eukprot:GHVN01095150.1.p1 GENE.GHVN01095150.1~~GHVN01095150.1.p1  ORF type:complete len:406 (-),score=59.46 GHVN01095150.1:162-1379(-)
MMILDRRAESAAVDPFNPRILTLHLMCAAKEFTPFVAKRDFLYFSDKDRDCSKAVQAVKNLQVEGSFVNIGDGCWKMGAYRATPQGHLSTDPHRSTHLRNIENEIISIVLLRSSAGIRTNYRSCEFAGYIKPSDKNKTRGGLQVIDTIEMSRAFFVVYPGAIYLNSGKEYLVEDLSVPTLEAFVRDAPNITYYTKTRDQTDVTIINTHETSYQSHGTYIQCKRGTLKVETRVWGFNKFDKLTGALIETSTDLKLPPTGYHSEGIWWEMTPELHAKIEQFGLKTMAGLHGASHALTRVVQLFVLCDRSDVGCECFSPFDTRHRPFRSTLFDTTPGGTGVCAQAFLSAGEVCREAAAMVQRCHCLKGCLSCVCDPRCGEYNECLDKKSAIFLLKAMAHSYSNPTDPF